MFFAKNAYISRLSQRLTIQVLDDMAAKQPESSISVEWSKKPNQEGQEIDLVKPSWYPL